MSTRAVRVSGGVVTDAILLENAADAAAFGAEVPAEQDVDIGWVKNPDGTFSAPAAAAPPDPTHADVDAERDRRVLAGLTVTVGGYAAPVRLAGDDMTTRNLQGLAFASSLRVAGGAGSVITPFRDEDNVVHDLNQAQVLDLWSQGAAFISAVFQAGWTIKDLPSIPVDYAADVRWP